MSSFLEEIIKSSSSSDNRVLCSSMNHDKLDMKIRNEINSLEQMTLEDNEKSLNSSADNWMFYLKKNIMDEYENMKINLKEITKIVIIKEIKSFESEMHHLRDQAVEQQSQINKFKNDIVNYKNNIKRLSEKFAASRDKKIESQCIYKWRLLREQIHRQRFCEKIAAKFHECTLKRKAFYGWKYNLEVAWKNRNNSQLEKNAQSICKDLVDEYEKQIVELKREISKLQEENLLMQTSRSTTQDAVKKALMRGVCALNMETMSILNQNGIITENGHDNPFSSSSRSPHVTSDFYTKNTGMYEDDQPRFPLNKYSKEINGSNNSSSLYGENYDHSIDNKFKTPKEDVCIPTKMVLPIYQQSTMLTDRSNNHHALKHLNETRMSNPKLPQSKTSAITIQAGNPTGSHTPSSSSSLNISVQKHTGDQLPNNWIQKRNVENYPEKRMYKK